VQRRSDHEPDGDPAPVEGRRRVDLRRDEGLPDHQNNQLAKFIEEGGRVFACRLGLALHGAREEDLMEMAAPPATGRKH
jgi:hypothetical protein